MSSSTRVTSARGGTMQRSFSRGLSGSCSENLPPRTLQRVAREVRDLHKNPPEGVRLVVDNDTGVPANLGELLAEIEGPTGTPYESKFFQLKLVLSADFPASPPRGHFLTKIYHPNVDMSTGAICVNTLKKDWSSETTFSHVLSVIRCLLIVPFPESSLNDEAGKLFMESYDEYAKRARLMADVHARSRSFSASDDDHAENVDGENPVAGGGKSTSPRSGGPLRNTSANTKKTLSRKNISRGAGGAKGTDKKKKSLRRL